MCSFRRCGGHRVVVSGDLTLLQAVVEIEEGRVVNYYTFEDELPMTEWLGGLIEVRYDEEGILRAYHNGKMIK